MPTRILFTAVIIAVMAVVAEQAKPDVFANVPEAAGFQVVYDLNIANSAVFNGVAVPYAVNNAAAHPDNSFSRVAYYMELQPTVGPNQWAWVSMNTFTNTASKIGIPNDLSGAFFQLNVTNMNVLSNVPGIVTGTGISTGNVELWSTNYAQANVAAVPNASAATFDFGDQATPGGYGSFQIHNHDLDGAGAGAAGQTIMGYNRWGSFGGNSDLGIGNQVGGSGNPDWTFAGNAATYTLKNLLVLVDNTPLPPPPPSLFVMPLGDSITFGSGAAGGYRTKLYNDLVAAVPTRTIDFVGSSNLNSSAGLGDLDHEGHGGYRIDQITNNLIANDGTGGNNGGFWLPGGPGGRPAVDPDIVLLHIGTNDISQGASPALAASRLDSLLSLLASERPDAIIILANLIPRNDGLEGTSNAFNLLIPGLVNTHRGLGQNIFFLDMHSQLTAADLIDSVHPNQTGYNKMADAWFSAVLAAQAAGIPEPASLGLLGIAALALGHRRRAA